MNKPFIIFLLISAVIAFVFLARPEIDLYVSSLFFDETRRFFLGGNLILQIIHKSVRYITITLASLWIILLIVSYIKKSEIFAISRKKLAYLILALIIGPGLVVNLVFKENWGRARPHQIENFGGSKEFSPPFIIAGQCKSNCSFVSGDPSVGFYFFALAFAFARKRKLFASVAITSGAIFGATRVMQGAHFLSDVIFSGIFTFTVCYLLYLWMFRKENGRGGGT